MLKKEIQLCAIGNALIDVQHRISDEMLQKFELKKGEMRLVESKFQVEIIKQIYENTKHLAPNKCSGGSATNTIEPFAKFGGKAAYLTTVGDDENGEFYYQELNNAKIQYKKNVVSDYPTGVCLVLITPDGERTMLTSLAASKQFATEHLDENLIAKSEWIYLEGYKFSENSGFEAINKSIEIAKKNGTKISLTASAVFIIEVFNEQFMSALRQSDLLFCNESEAKSIAQHIENKEVTNSDEAMKIISKICPNVVMTQGKAGAKVLFGGKNYAFSACEVTAVDTTGAGDMFAGAFLYGLLNYEQAITRVSAGTVKDLAATVSDSSDYEAKKLNFAGKLASKASSLIVSQLGARYSGDFPAIIEDVLD